MSSSIVITLTPRESLRLMSGPLAASGAGNCDYASQRSDRHAEGLCRGLEAVRGGGRVGGLFFLRYYGPPKRPGKESIDLLI